MAIKSQPQLLSAPLRSTVAPLTVSSDHPKLALATKPNKEDQPKSSIPNHQTTVHPIHPLQSRILPGLARVCNSGLPHGSMLYQIDGDGPMTQCGGDGHGDDGVGSIGGKGGQGLALTQAEVSRTGGYTRGQLSTNPRTGGTRELRQLQLLHHQHQCRGHPLTTPIATQTTPPLPYQCSKQQGNLTVKALGESLS